MAVEYDRWTDQRAIDEATAAELQEIAGDGITITYDENYNGFLFEADDKNKLTLSKTSSSKVWINNTAYTLSNDVHTIRYFAKRSGDLLIAVPNVVGLSCCQIAIGRCSDGSCGIIGIGKGNNSAPYDIIYPICKNAPPYNTSHFITNFQAPNKMFLSLRKLVLKEDVTFDNMYVNTYGYTDPFSIIEMNGERYASAYGGTTNLVFFLMKL